MAKKFTSKELIEIVGTEFQIKSQKEIAEFLEITQGRVSQISQQAGITKTIIKSLMRAAFNAGKKEAKKEINTTLLDSFKDQKKLGSQTQIAKELGRTPSQINQFYSGKVAISKTVIEQLLKDTAKISIKPIFEMMMVDPGRPSGNSWFIFYNDKTGKKSKELKNKVSEKRGIYCYYDSRGHLTYAGKADKTDLFIELQKRLSQEVAKDRLRYWEGLKKHAKGKKLRQGDFVKFISAYEVTPKEAIPIVEAILIRATGNTQFNNRLENLV